MYLEYISKFEIQFMKYVRVYESWSQEKTVVLESIRNRARITLTVQGGRIQNIDNPRGIRFPWSVGQTLNRSLETWACNQGFLINGKDPCPEEKIFGVRTSQVPRGHEWRTIFPGKFKK
jgi:hypothetical protein